MHDWDLLSKALEPEPDNEKVNFDFPLVLYRDVFDQFFTYLDRINHYINVGLFGIRDIEALRYWIQELQNPRYLEAGKDTQKFNPFLDFVDKYGYLSVKELMVKFALESKRSK